MSAREVPVEELLDYYVSLAGGLMKNHKKRFADTMKSVREASLGLENAAARFGAGVKNAWGTLDKITSEYGMRLVQIIQEKAQNLARIDAESNYQSAEKFHEDAVRMLNEIIITVRRYVPRLHRALKSELAGLNGALAKLENSIRALGIALDGSPGSKLESLERDIQTIIQRQGELQKLRSEEQQETSSLNEINRKEKAVVAEKEKLTAEPDFLELKKYEDALASRENEIRQFLQPLAKPLLKLERAASNERATSIDMRTLRNVIDKPVETVVTGQSFALLGLLNSLEEALRRGSLEVEERKRRKTEETIMAIRDNATDRLRDDYLTLQANTQETLRQLRTKGLLEKRESLDKTLAEIHNQEEATTTKLKDLQRRRDELTKTILKQKASIESQIVKIANRSIVIRAT